MRDLTGISSGLSILQRKENKRMKIRREMFFISRLLLTGSPRSRRLLGVILCIFENGMTSPTSRNKIKFVFCSAKNYRTFSLFTFNSSLKKNRIQRFFFVG